MKRHRIAAWLASAAVAALLASCGGIISPEVSSALDDAREIQYLLPTLTASHALVQPGTGEAVARLRNIYPGNAAGLPATPLDLWNARPAGATEARFPSTGYLEDFYEAGNWAYLVLVPTADGWGEYQVSLYIYPTLSAAVWYTLEQYRVVGSSWENMVDSSEQPDATAYEAYQTHYFDGRVEARTLMWSRYADPDGQDRVYDQTYFAMPADFSGTELDYPATIPQPAKVTAADALDFASHMESSIPKIGGNDPDTTAVEFYNQVHSSGGYARQSTSYVTDTFRFSGNTVVAYTVRMYASDDATGTKSVMAKSSASFSRAWKSWQQVTTEDIDISTNATTGVMSYASQLVSYRDAVEETRVAVSLTETGAGTAEFAGTMTVTKTGKNPSTSQLSMTRDTGVDITAGSGITDLAFRATTSRAVVYDVGEVITLAAPGSSSSASRTFTITLSSGGQFTGAYVGGILEGIYSSGGATHAMSIGSLFVSVDDTVD